MPHQNLSLLLLSLSACALFPNRDPVNINVVGLEPLPSQDLEVRFAIKLRVQNPNEAAIDYNGVALDLEVNGRPLASGVSDQAVCSFSDQSRARRKGLRSQRPQAFIS